jgi:hypothetical protein
MPLTHTKIFLKTGVEVPVTPNISVVLLGGGPVPTSSVVHLGGGPVPTSSVVLLFS